MFKALWELIKFIFRFIRDSIVLTIIVLGVNLLLNPVGLSEFKKLGNIPSEVHTTRTTTIVQEKQPKTSVIKITQNGGDILSNKAYLSAVDRGLPKGASMTVPSSNGVYLVYVDKNSDKQFVNSANVAVNNWITKGRIPMRVTDDKKQAQIVMRLTDNFLANNRIDGSMTTGVTTMAEHSLEKKTNIVISKAACERSSSNYEDTIEHELGHALGLEHNKRPHDLMNAVNKGTVHMTQYDIQQAQRNYRAVENIKDDSEDPQ